MHWIGLDVLATSAHEISGLATFVVALPIVFWLGRPHPVDQGNSDIFALCANCRFATDLGAGSDDNPQLSAAKTDDE